MPRKKKGFQVLSRSYINVAYGAISVVVLFMLLFLGIKAITHRTGTIDDQAAQTTAEFLKKTYVVAAGDNLWTIAEAKYNNGYAWVEIAKENNIENPDVINAGDELVIPSVSITPTPTLSKTISNPPSEQKITSNSYIVQGDDNLWNIAVRAYGDGYKWVEIARANNLANPDLIFSGNMLKLPR